MPLKRRCSERGKVLTDSLKSDDDADPALESELELEDDADGDIESSISDEIPTETQAESGRSPFVVAAFAALAVFALDQVTKGWAVSRLADGACTPETCVDVVGSLRFRLHYNTGASFSTGEGLGPIIGVIALVMSGYLLWLARSAAYTLQAVLLGTIAGGALGNLADRLFRATDGILSGGVVDFIDFQWWPIFNIADVGIVGGVIALLLTQFVRGAEPESSP